MRVRIRALTWELPRGVSGDVDVAFLSDTWNY